MSNQDSVLAFLRSISPKTATNSIIGRQTNVSPHQQVFAITQELLRRGLISGNKVGAEWEFWSEYRGVQPNDPPVLPLDQVQAEYKRHHPAPTDTIPNVFTPGDFELLAQKVLSELYSTNLAPRRILGFPKLFDLVSLDHAIIGDAKYFTMVQGERTPPAKFSIIAEHVWLLEHSSARWKFLIFGNDRRVPQEWLARYGSLVRGVQFYFLAADGRLAFLNEIDQERQRRYSEIHSR